MVRAGRPCESLIATGMSVRDASDAAISRICFTPSAPPKPFCHDSLATSRCMILCSRPRVISRNVSTRRSSIRPIRDQLIGVGEDGPLDPQAVAVVRVVGQACDDLLVVGPPPVNLTPRPIGLASNHSQDANVVEVMIGEQLQMGVEARAVVLVGPRRPEQRRAKRGEFAGIIGQHVAADAHFPRTRGRAVREASVNVVSSRVAASR